MPTRYRLPVFASSVSLDGIGRKEAAPDGWFWPSNPAEEAALVAMGCTADDPAVPGVDPAAAPVDLPNIVSAVRDGDPSDRAELQYLVSGGVNVAISNVIPLNGRFVMPQRVINGALTFTAGAGAIPFGSCYLRLVADGANVPVFPGYPANSSNSWDNTTGRVNLVTIWHDGTGVYYSISQGIGEALYAAPPGDVTLTVTPGSNSASVLFTSAGGGAPSDYSAQYRVQGSPTWLDFVDGVSSMASMSVTNLSVSTSYEFRGKAINGGGESGWSPVVVATTTTAESVQHLPMEVLTAITQSGDATSGFSYTATSAGFSSYAGSALHYLDGDGYIQAKVGAGLSLLGFKDGATKVGAAYADGAKLIVYNESGSTVKCVVDGSGGVSGNVNASYPSALPIYLRVRRAGTTLYAEASSDGIAWTVTHQMAGVSGRLYPWVGGYNVGDRAEMLTSMGLAS